ncbi:MAG: DUF305 domain-containing protein [Bradyrhizobium sp.]|nr:DUF305 domain-containing protein [Bradyrhizobium sp.]
MARKNYRMLAIASVGMLILMYFIMFTMIYSWGEFVQNINFFYMSIMMATPMVAMMPLMMGSMYPDRKLNMLIYIGGAILFVLAFIGIRGQLLVGNEQFLRSMIPHHSGAILMCEQANISDPEIKSLCGEIIGSQKREIDEMKQIMKRY